MTGSVYRAKRAKTSINPGKIGAARLSGHSQKIDGTFSKGAHKVMAGIRNTCLLLTKNVIG
jgi:hypothetical protein